jgi:tRNA U34 2-thiouridine synthase MnmA/TrmU
MSTNAPKPAPVRALGLLSGGLDSRLAVCVVREQGIEVHGIVFDSPFFNLAAARSAANQLKIPLHIVEFTPDILELIRHPPHGFGACMNPCIDCHARMLRRAGEFMQQNSFHFLFTGEVLNERPMSQNRKSLDVVAADSGYADTILRPLSARLLPETRMEQQGWVDRTRLLALEGRGRNPQFTLAKHYGLTEYPTPASGCLLTDPAFCRRLKDLKTHEGLANTSLIRLLKVGRHFRLESGARLIVGRNESDNLRLEEMAPIADYALQVEDIPGPTALLIGSAAGNALETAAALCGRYADAQGLASVRITARSTTTGEVRTLNAPPMPAAAVSALMVG